jgi:hypothetical protein
MLTLGVLRISTCIFQKDCRILFFLLDERLIEGLSDQVTSFAIFQFIFIYKENKQSRYIKIKRAKYFDVYFE